MGSTKKLFPPSTSTPIDRSDYIRMVEEMIRDGRDWPFIGRRLGFSGWDARKMYEQYMKGK